MHASGLASFIPKLEQRFWAQHKDASFTSATIMSNLKYRIPTMVSLNYP